MNSKEKSTYREVSIVLAISIVMIGLEVYISSEHKHWEKLTLVVYVLGLIMYSINLLKRIFKNHKLTKRNLIALLMAFLIVEILAIPSENNSFTECGIGSVYTKHYYHEGSYSEVTSEGCEVTGGGIIKLIGTFVVVLYLSYLSLLVLERREKENELGDKSKKVKKESDKEIQARFDDSFDESPGNSFENNDYKNIPF